ncbi:MAG: pilus assembly protein PilM [Phycisphaerae bacterium]|nr:pilus assembly protein PilM [Phycisphaerae bacterium]
MSRSFSWVPRHIGPIGIDFGARVVRMLQLARHKGQLTMTCYAQREIPEGVTDAADRRQLQMQAVQDMLKTERFSGRNTATALSWDDLNIRNVRIPTMPEGEIATAIRFEAGDRFGMDATQAEMRFLVAGDVRQGTDIRQEVIVLAAGRKAIDAHVQRLTQVGLHPVAIDAQPCALFRCFERFLRRDEDSNQVNAFVDIGYTGTRVIMSRGAELTFIKSIPIGGRRFDELVSEGMELSTTEAAQLRIRLHRYHVAMLTGQEMRIGPDEAVGEGMRRAILDAQRPALEQLSKEIALCIRYCSVTFRGPRSDSVTVLGGEACNAELLQLLSDQVHVPFRVGKPMRNITLESAYGSADRRTGQPEWATVLGLALKPTIENAAVAS